VEGASQTNSWGQERMEEEDTRHSGGLNHLVLRRWIRACGTPRIAQRYARPSLNLNTYLFRESS